MTGITQVSN